MHDLRGHDLSTEARATMIIRPSCFLTPLKFYGRNPTIPPDPRLDSGWATGPSTCLPKGPAPDRPSDGRGPADRNSLRASARSVSGSRMPRCASCMIFSATKRVAGSSFKLKPRSLQTSSSAIDITLVGTLLTDLMYWRTAKGGLLGLAGHARDDNGLARSNRGPEISWATASCALSRRRGLMPSATRSR
jgi:hypothetical protein